MVNAYAIGVSISTVSNDDAVLGLMLRRILGVEGALGRMTGRLNALKPAIAAALGLLGGAYTVGWIWDAIKKSEELNKQLERLKLTGVSPQDVLAARATAFTTSFQVPTTTPAEDVAALNKLQTQLPNLADAQSVLADVQRLSYVIKFATGADTKTSLENAVKFADLTGQIFTKLADGTERVDPAKFVRMMDVVERMVTASGGLISPQGLLQFAQQSGLAIRAMDPDQIARLGEAMIAMGPRRAGTAETSLLQQFAGGMMSRRSVEGMQNYGLLQSGEWKAERGGAIVLSQGARERLGALAVNPKQFAAQIAEKLAGEGKSKIDIVAAIADVFGRATTQRLVGELVMGAPQIERFLTIYNRIPSTGQNYAELQQHSLQTNIDSLSAAWTGLMQAIGEPGIPVAISVMHGLTDAIHFVTSAVADHPEAAKFLLEFGATLAGVITVASTLALTNIAIRALGGALGGLSPAAAAFGPGGSAAAGLTGIIGLLGKLSLVGGAAMAGLEAGGFLSRMLDKGGEAKHPVIDPLFNWLYRTLGIDGSGNLPQPAKGPLAGAPAALAPPRSPFAPRTAVPLAPVGSAKDPFHVKPVASDTPPPGSDPAHPAYVALPSGSISTTVTNVDQIGRAAASAAVKQATRPQDGATGGSARDSSAYPLLNYGGGF